MSTVLFQVSDLGQKRPLQLRVQLRTCLAIHRQRTVFPDDALKASHNMWRFYTPFCADWQGSLTEQTAQLHPF